MSLPCATKLPANVLSRGTHAGHQWVTMRNRMGYRCGYVRVPAGHPWHGKEYDVIDARAHGGLTYCKADDGTGDGGWWFGFDCCHAGDAADPSLPSEITAMRPMPGDVVRTQAYVEAQCRSLCEQAVVAGGNRDMLEATLAVLARYAAHDHVADELLDTLQARLALMEGDE